MSEALLNVAHAISSRIAADAVRDGRRCTWIADRPLGPGLYSGSAGIGVTLLEVGAATGDAALIELGVAGLRHAAGGQEPGSAVGLFDGRAGVAVACLRGALLCGEEELTHSAERLLEAALGDTRGARIDLIGGAAGVAIALLAAADHLGRPDMVERAGEIGDHIIDAGVPDGDTLGWWSPVVASSAPLTGLSHGAAGIGLALHELAAATGEARFRAAGSSAFRHERRLRDRVGNYPDLRDLGEDRGFLPQSRFAWCHGAPGIALARHRAWVLTADDAYRDEAREALDITVRWLGAAIAADRGVFSLCHGLAGNAEILRLCAAALAPQRRAAAAQVVRDVAELGIEEYAGDPSSWPCGPREPPPGLMDGLAGIALFYLGLAEGRTLPFLLPTVEMVRSARGARAATGSPPAPSPH